MQPLWGCYHLPATVLQLSQPPSGTAIIIIPILQKRIIKGNEKYISINSVSLYCDSNIIDKSINNNFEIKSKAFVLWGKSSEL